MPPRRRLAVLLPWSVLILVYLVLATLTPAAEAANAIVQAPCNETAFDTALATVQNSGGGTLTFNCGTATLAFLAEKLITSAVTINGAGQITLDGGGATRLFNVDAAGALTLQGMTLTGGYAPSPDYGGAIISAGPLVIANSVVRGNQADSLAVGGAISTYAPVTITDSLFEDNSAGQGGAIYIFGPTGRLSIARSVFQHNHATDLTFGWGGALLIYNGAQATLAASDFYSNTAKNGGALYNYFSTVTITTSLLRENSALSHGGALDANGSPALTTLEGSTLRDNRALFGGGASQDQAQLHIYNSTLRGNAASGAGGAIGNVGYVSVTNSLLLSNTAALNGGGLYTSRSGQMTNVTLSGNQAQQGGGLYMEQLSGSHALTLTNLTVADNSGLVDGGGLELISGTLTLLSSVLADNSPGGNCGSLGLALTYNLYNWSTDGSCALGGPRDNANVLLGPLGNNGGPTLTYLPQLGSPVIDDLPGSCPPPTTDQRGAPRPFDYDGFGGAACDGGAVEAGPQWLKVLVPLVVR